MPRVICQVLAEMSNATVWIMPKIAAPVMFGTPEADRILEAMQVFPPDNPWNQDVSKMPVHADSARMIASIGADKNLGYNLDMGFILVPPDQKRVPTSTIGMGLPFPVCIKVSASDSSSRVPKPPGSTAKASDISNIFCLR